MCDRCGAEVQHEGLCAPCHAVVMGGRPGWLSRGETPKPSTAQTAAARREGIGKNAKWWFGPPGSSWDGRYTR